MPASGKWASKCSGASSFGAWTWLCECQVASTASPTSSLWSLRRTRRGWPIPWAKPWTRARLVLFRAGGRSGKGCATVRCRGHPAGVPGLGVNTRSLGSEERHVGHGPFPGFHGTWPTDESHRGLIVPRRVRHAVGLLEYDVPLVVAVGYAKKPLQRRRAAWVTSTSLSLVAVCEPGLSCTVPVGWKDSCVLHCCLHSPWIRQSLSGRASVHHLVKKGRRYQHIA